MINALILLAALKCFSLSSQAMDRDRDARAAVFLTLGLGLFAVLLTRTVPGVTP